MTQVVIGGIFQHSDIPFQGNKKTKMWVIVKYQNNVVFLNVPHKLLILQNSNNIKVLKINIQGLKIKQYKQLPSGVNVYCEVGKTNNKSCSQEQSKNSYDTQTKKKK